eukprot:TRINITY_DN43248_c0_g1_i1.p1 TRINITY_DN43248_c0_g1~~TRINITY_DN43248_c0_g1_i1.p1  ORF type:complete len:101 (+),score=22.35 TRINITY_DN43248_c0_g1_i1:103-405(+)
MLAGLNITEGTHETVQSRAVPKGTVLDLVCLAEGQFTMTNQALDVTVTGEMRPAVRIDKKMEFYRLLHDAKECNLKVECPAFSDATDGPEVGVNATDGEE